MLKFIICEDNSFFLSKDKDIINHIMFNNNIEYKIKNYSEYNNLLLDEINNKSGKKIYILDIELGNSSGIDIANKIRENDWDSIIIISSAHMEMFSRIFTKRLLIFDFVSKFDNYEKNLNDSLNKAIDIISQSKSLVIKIKSLLINLKFNEILYLKYDKFERKTFIVTFDNLYKVSKPLSTVFEKLNYKFIKINKSLIINKDNLKEYNYLKKEIIFVNNMKISNINLKEKEIKNYAYI